MGPFRIDSTGGKHKISRRFVLFKNLKTRFVSCSAVVNFGVHGAIVLYGISWYTESYYRGFLLYLHGFVTLGSLLIMVIIDIELKKKYPENRVISPCPADNLSVGARTTKYESL